MVVAGVYTCGVARVINVFVYFLSSKELVEELVESRIDSSSSTFRATMPPMECPTIMTWRFVFGGYSENICVMTERVNIV